MAQRGFFDLLNRDKETVALHLGSPVPCKRTVCPSHGRWRVSLVGYRVAERLATSNGRRVLPFLPPFMPELRETLPYAMLRVVIADLPHAVPTAGLAAIPTR